MDNHNETSGPSAGSLPDGGPGEEMIKVVDRRGRVKHIPRSEYERKKRRRKRRERSKNVPLRDVLSIAFILAVIIIASYFALKIIK